jgi:Met-zincin/Domain of unknown function (DUF5117)
MNVLSRATLFALITVCWTSPVSAQDEPTLPALDETVEGWEAHEGFLTLYTKDGEERLLAAVPESLLDQPFFLATSVAGGSDYAGWQWEDNLVRFERFGDKLLLVELNTQQRANEDKPIHEVVRRTYADRLMADLGILAEGGGALLIDLGELLVTDYGTFFGGWFSLDTSLSRFRRTKAFPSNIEVAVQMPLYGDGTFVTLAYSISRLPAVEDYTPRQADDRLGYFVTAIRDYTEGDPDEGRMVRLVNRWKLEKADPSLDRSPPLEPIVFYIENTVPIAYREAVAEGILEWNRAFEAVGIVGAIVVRQQTETQFDDIDPEDVRYNFFRWITSESAFAMGPSRVDPRTGRILDADIIFDDSMLRGYQREYDVMIREAPEKLLNRFTADYLRRNPQHHPLARFMDETRDPQVARLRSILGELFEGGRVPAGVVHDTLEAAGIDPATTRGEMRELSSRLRHDRCSVGAGLPHQIALMSLAIDTLAVSQPGLREEYLREVIKETVMHEVGHTLGLRHNFKASSLLDLDDINSPEKPRATSASVMDYHPTNLSVEEDHPQGHFLCETIGPYDMLAIQYGYMLCEEDADELKLVPRQVAEQGLPYGTDEDTGSPDPHITRWDLGDDPVKFAEYRRALVAKLWANLEERAVEDDESYSRLRRAFDMTLYEIGQSSLFVSRVVGGLDFHRDHKGDPNARQPISVVDSAEQRRALNWVCDNLFAEGAFDVSPDLLSKLAAGRWVHWGTRDGNATLDYPLLDKVNQVQTWALFFLTADDTLARLWENEQHLAGSADANPLTIPELFDTLETAIFSELSSPNPEVGRVRQNLQDAYVRRLVAIALGKGISPPVANKLAWSRLKGLEERFGEALERNLDPYTRAHLEALGVQSQQARAAQYVHVASGGCALVAQDERSTPIGVMALLLVGLLIVRRRTLGGSRSNSEHATL